MSSTKDLTTRSLEILAELGSRPAVAYWEADVAARIRGYVAEMGLAADADDYGNIVVRCPGEDQGQPPMALVAHMDHPGFEALETQGDLIIARAMGGVPQACFSQPVPVQLLAPDGGRRHGERRGASA